MTRRALGPAALLVALAACSHGPKHPPVTVAVRLVERTDVGGIVQLLDRGDRDGAKKRVRAGLKTDPDNPSLQVLRDSIEKDPKDLLGPTNWPYTVRPGETMIGLAERFLGNALKAYQLARYNGIDVPQSLAAGQVLRIPGEPPRVELPRADPPRKPAPVAARPAATRAKVAAPKPIVSPTDPAGAQRLRAAGLAALNAGTPGRAVLALRRAAVLDPGNPLIARDLARAQRIATTVQARK